MKMYSFLIILMSFVMLETNCSRTENQTKKEPMNPAITTFQELEKLNGKKVTIRGTYTLHNPYPSKKAAGGKINLPIQIVLEEDAETGVFLEPFWHENAIRASSEIASFEGKKVEVTGTYHAEMPQNPKTKGRNVASLGGLCLHPVTKIVLLE